MGQQRVYPHAHGSDHCCLDGDQCGESRLQLPKIFKSTFEADAEVQQSPPDSAEAPEEARPPVIRDCIEEVREQYQLTPREKEVVELIYRGRTNREIAEMLFLSESTVKTHVYNIFRKMGVKNRVGILCIINEETMEQMEDREQEQ